MQVFKLQAQKQPIELNNLTITLLTLDEFKRCAMHVSDIHCRWWLRTLNNKFGYLSMSGIYSDQNYDEKFKEIDSHTRCGVRPVLKYAKTDVFKIEDRFEFGGHIWTVIDNGIALCDNLIADEPFYHKNSGSDNMDTYENSDIQAFLDGWLKDKIYIAKARANNKTLDTDRPTISRGLFVAPFL